MNEETIAIYVRAACSASFLVSNADGEIAAEEIAAFMSALKAFHDFELDADDVVESFRDALELDEDEHLSEVAGAAGLSEELRREILTIALAVAAADGEVLLSEVLCLPDIASALNIELGSDDEDEEDEEDEGSEEDEASEAYEASLRQAEAALRAEGNVNPSRSDIVTRAAADLMSGMSSRLDASIVQRRGFAAWQTGDYEAAYQFYIEAAEAGDKDAMYNLGQMYMAGEWVDVDLDQALSWWKRAAADGHLNAQRNAWKAFKHRDDLKSALEYSRMAAAQGDEESADFFREQTSKLLLAAGLITGALTAEADGRVSDEELISYGEAWKSALGIDYTLEDLRADFAYIKGDGIDEEEHLEAISILASNIPLDLRQRVLNIAILVALADREFSPEEQEMVEKLAAALEVDLSDLGNGLGLRRREDLEESDHPSKPDHEENYDPEINPVLVASLHGDVDKVRELLSAGYSATDVHESGTDAVILAVREGHLEIVRILLEAGADPNRINPQSGTTPLRMAVQQTRTEIAELLLRKGADAELFDEASGVGPLTVLAGVAPEFNGTEAVYLLDLLIAAGAKQRPFGAEGLELSVIGIAAMKQGLPAGFLTRLAEGADKKDLDLALWMAAMEGEATNVSDLIAAGADVNMTVPELKYDSSAAGDSPINAAATRGHTECVRQIIAAGSDVNRNAPPEGGQFPLLMASENGHSEIVAMLLEAGADASLVNPENGTHPLGGAVRGGHSEIVALLLNAGADPNVASDGYGGPQIIFAANDGNLGIVQDLIEHGADVNAAGSEFGNTALILAANQGHSEIVELLLRHGADPNKVNPINGSDALLAAVMGQRVQCVRLLLEVGADPNRTYAGESGDVPLLIIASDKGFAEIVRLLLEHGADINTEGGDGLTALQRAGINRHKEVEAVLLEFGADPSTRLVKFTDTPAGQEIENEILSRMARNLKETADTIRTLEAGDTPDELEPESRPRGFFSRLFGWGRRP